MIKEWYYSLDCKLGKIKTCKENTLKLLGTLNIHHWGEDRQRVWDRKYKISLRRAKGLDGWIQERGISIEYDIRS